MKGVCLITCLSFKGNGFEEIHVRFIPFNPKTGQLCTDIAVVSKLKASPRNSIYNNYCTCYISYMWYYVLLWVSLHFFGCILSFVARRWISRTAKEEHWTIYWSFWGWNCCPTEWSKQLVCTFYLFIFIFMYSSLYLNLQPIWMNDHPVEKGLYTYVFCSLI